MMLTAGNLGQVSHGLLYQIRNCLIILVDSLTSLEVDIIVLCCTADAWMIRVQCLAAELVDCIPVQNLAQLLIRNQLDLLNLVGGTEAIKEVQEWNLALDGNQMSNSSQIHNLLYGGFSQHGHTSLAGSHNILMIAEDVQGAGSQSTGADMEYARQELARDLVHIWNHQQHALGCCVGGGQGTSLQGTVYSTGCTGLGLHLDDIYLLAKEIQLALGSHLVNVLGHWRRWGNRIDCGYIRKCVGHIGSGSVTIHCFHLFAHGFTPPHNHTSCTTTQLVQPYIVYTTN